MADKPFLRRVAGLLQLAPWIAPSAMRLWRWRQARFSAGVAGVVFNPVGQVLLVEHVFHPNAPWGLPGGWVDRREDPANALRREMQEELALKVEVGPVLLVELDFGNHLDLAYLCTADGSIGQLSSELLDHGWFNTTELPRLHKFHYRAIMRALDMLSKVVE
jgi:ADP-ribose pyrophosphatase YjhB (NUDIX family)